MIDNPVRIARHAVAGLASLVWRAARGRPCLCAMHPTRAEVRAYEPGRVILPTIDEARARRHR